MLNKKVCILTPVHPVFDTRIFHKEAKTLIDAGYDVTLIAQHDKNKTVDGIKIIALPKPKNRFERFIKLDYLTYKKAIHQKANIYHFHDPELIPWMVKLKKKTKAKIIYDVHEDVAKQILSKYWLPKIFRRLIAYNFDKYEKYIAKKIDYIIAATPDIKNNFKQNNIIDIKNYPTIINVQKIKNRGEREYTELIYIGGLSRIRGIKKIIESLKHINLKYSVKLKLIGKFSNQKFKQEIKNISKRNSNIIFLGWCSQKKVYKNLLRSDIAIACLFPLKRFQKNIGLKIYEYMNAQLPIIASNFPLWIEVIEKNKCGICVDPLKPKEIAKAIEYLIEHPDEAKKMGENGRRAVLEKYNWENESKKLLEIYKKLLE